MPGFEVRRCLSRLLPFANTIFAALDRAQRVVAKKHGSKFRYLKKSEPRWNRRFDDRARPRRSFARVARSVLRISDILKFRSGPVRARTFARCQMARSLSAILPNQIRHRSLLSRTTYQISIGNSLGTLSHAVSHASQPFRLSKETNASSRLFRISSYCENLFSRNG